MTYEQFCKAAGLTPSPDAISLWLLSHLVPNNLSTAMGKIK